MKIRLNKYKITIFIIAVSAIICGIITGTFIAITKALPEIRSLETYRPSSVTRIYSADNILLAELFIEKRAPISLEIAPRYLKEAIIATEDRNFYRHGGVDFKGILRAMIKDILAVKFVEGASTITQQLAKTLFLTSKKTLSRKLKEAILAFQIERRYTKDEILELYMNQVYFGSGAYGVESASRIFFGKPVSILDLGECALIAGMPKSPSRYSPLINPKLAIKRRNIVLNQMHNTGVIDESAFKIALKTGFTPPVSANQKALAPYFIDYIKESLEEAIGDSMLYRGGLTIHTTLNMKMQEKAIKAVKRGLEKLESRMKKRNMSVKAPQCAMVAVDVETGGILSMVGGWNYKKSRYNRAIKARRQPGSAFKPIIYATAIEEGIPQNHLILDAPKTYKGGNKGKIWRPKNFSGDFKGEMTLRYALAKSRNIPTIQLLEMIGINNVIQLAQRLGIKSPLGRDLSLALGTYETTLLELTGAYSVFPNQGEAIKPFGVIRVKDHNQRVIWQNKIERSVAMSRSGAAIMCDMLKAVVEEGTGKKAKKLSRPIAGKTGTTDNYKDALFIGFSPSISTGVWVGQDNNHSLGNLETGAKAALPIWIDFMEKALNERPWTYFDIPDDIVKAPMNPGVGALTSGDDYNPIEALFKSGTEPKSFKEFK